MSEIKHHYTESGLQNVYIRGIAIEIDDDGDEIITIPLVNQLHAVISLGIVSHPKGMSGDELRFLRTEMSLTQAELAVTVHHDKQSIGRWERGDGVLDSSAETVIRRLAIEKLGLKLESGIDELSRQSVPTATVQPITIVARKHGYDLEAA